MSLKSRMMSATGVLLTSMIYCCLILIFAQRMHSSQWVVVYDSGSSGTRATVYRFQRGTLPSYAKQITTSKAISAIDHSLTKPTLDELSYAALGAITGGQAKVKCFFGATAGMRNLAPGDIHIRLSIARSVILEQCGKSPVYVIDGETEAQYILSAVTAMVGGSPCVADLGGQSLQIAHRQSLKSFPRGGLNFAKSRVKALHCFKDFAICSRAVRKLTRFMTWKKVTPRPNYYLTSGFVYVARLIGLPIETQSVAEVEEAAVSACNRMKSCFEAVYIYRLLRDVLNLEKHTSVTFLAKVEDIPATWSLGAALEICR